jgi:hypothetical protein
MRLLGLLFALSLTAGCNDRTVVAKQIVTRSDLIGGPRAIGEVGDYLLANEQIRVIIQNEGYSRGFGIYGGSLIDADLMRPATFGDSSGGKGNDNFSELFPGLFLKAMRPTGIETQNNEDGSASVIVRGEPDDFIFLAQNIIDAIVVSDDLRFRNEYRLAPGKRYVEITTTISYQGTAPSVELPDDSIGQFLGDGIDFPLPVGDVILFGKGNSVFSEQAGFDVRFTLEELYRQPVELPRLPGLLTPFLASKGERVSYGFMSGVTDPKLSLFARAEYPAPADSLLIPFLASSFTGAFYAAAPPRLYSRERVCDASDCPATCGAEAACPDDFNCVEGKCRADAFSFKKYFIVGSGDVASIRDVVHEIRGDTVGRVSGIVREKFTLEPEAHVSVMTFDASGSPYNQHTTDSSGNFMGSYEPGTYSYRVVADGIYPTAPVTFEVTAGATSFLEIETPSPGLVSVRILGEDGLLIPGKCSLVGTYTAAAAGFEGREFLYDFKLDESYRATDLVRDSADPSTRRFVEEVILAADGMTTEKVRPGEYRAVCSRGMEYELHEQEIVVKEGGHVTVDAMLRRAFDTRGWVSGDYHLHALNSVDSSLPLSDRVSQVAAEGVDIACSTDHNFVTDYGQAIASQGIERFVQGMIGLEMTTIEIGHFNGFPLRYDAEPITKGAFEWSGRAPQALFDDIRALGAYSPEETVVQVNHPRDTILGYFNDYNVDQDTMEPRDGDNALLTPECDPDVPCEFGKENFSWDFDAIEVFNGKRWDLLRTYRVPEELPPPPLPDNIPAAGEILRDSSGEIAYPGALEDWFQLLNAGRIYTATGNSDTHDLDDEAGIPRTYTPASDDRAGAIDELEIVAAMKNQRALVTNGPFVLMEVAAGGCFDRRSGERLERTVCNMGDVAEIEDGRATVTVEVRTASWVPIERINLIVNGEIVASVEGDRDTLSRFSTDLEINGDGWVVAEVIGEQSMFPVIAPREIPSIQVSDAIGSIAGSFGFDFNAFGNLRPSQTRIATPYAFTNPIFLDAGGTEGAYDPPGVKRQALTAAPAGRVDVKKPTKRDVPALLRVFQLFGGHGH